MSVFSKTSKTLNHNYQPGVDGLRAVAVLLVLIFHVGFDAFPGGFIGVDVFFVISGYLITGILFNQMLKGSFSYVDFILARIARLYPALLFTLAFVFAGCFLLYSPADFADVSRSAIYAIFSATNIFFANSAGYFDTSSEINPLLHTWSLGVEQQFYIVWPILLSLALFKRKQLVTYLLVVVSLVSLLASQWATTHMQTEAYYWMPFRVFELSLGGIAFLISRSTDINKLLKEAMMSIGLIMIIVSAATFSSSTQFPGLNALIPVVGSMLCILSHDAKFAGYVVNNKISVAIGIISYSVYLIHWPLIVFYKYWIFREINSLEKTFILALSLVIGFAMYYGIENRFRKMALRSISYRQACFYGLTIAIMISFCITIKSNGFPFRAANDIAINYADNKKFHHDFFGGTGFKQGHQIIGDKSAQPKFVLMGDSFARQYANAIKKHIGDKSYSVAAFFADGCYLSASFTRMWNGVPGKECLKMYKEAIEYAENNNIPVVYAQRWIGYKGLIGDEHGVWASFKSDNDYAIFLVNNIRRMSSNLKSNLYVLLAPNGAGVSGVLSCLSRPKLASSFCMQNMETHLGSSRVDKINNLIATKIVGDEKIKIINVNERLCKMDICSPVDEGGEILYSDSVHLSKYGAELSWEYISKKSM